MPEWLWTTVLVLAAALGYFAFVAFMGRIRKGQFSIQGAATDLVRIRTDVGTFSLNAASRVLTVEVTGQRRNVPFNEIRAVRYGYKTEPAWLTELAFGIDLWDMFSRWTDQCEWYAISLVLVQEPEIPLYMAGQVERREPFLGWWYRILTGALQRVGMHEDVEGRSRAVLDEVLAAFVSVGHQLRLA